ncbi:hypothetical protein [Rhizomonospora bruguierae]|uniref:hypothetical protein n=1 Tax=Rhizomonospora bruguierae TaxID=1581705 RepID=UPI001BCAE3AB|nr:hypothetical protein [Micromonospora sp. NBRC 107566]
MSATTDRTWIDDFVVELRLRGASGRAIGDAVASVREFLRGSGQSATEAFGSPREYAASLDLTSSAKPKQQFPTVARSLAGLIAFIGFSMATTSWLRGDEKFRISAGQLLVFAVLLVLVLLLPLYLNVLLRYRWLLVAVVIAGAGMGAFLTLAEPRGPANTTHAVFAVPPVLAVIVTAAVLVALSIEQSIAALSGAGVDPVREPLTTAGSVRGRRGAVGIALGLAWMYPAAARFYLGAVLLLAH